MTTKIRLHLHTHNDTRRLILTTHLQPPYRPLLLIQSQRPTHNQPTTIVNHRHRTNRTDGHNEDPPTSTQRPTPTTIPTTIYVTMPTTDPHPTNDLVYSHQHQRRLNAHVNSNVRLHLRSTNDARRLTMTSTPTTNMATTSTTLLQPTNDFVYKHQHQRSLNADSNNNHRQSATRRTTPHNHNDAHLWQQLQHHAAYHRLLPTMRLALRRSDN